VIGAKMRLNQLRKRSLKELDDVIEEILVRNPDFMIELDKILGGTEKKATRSKGSRHRYARNRIPVMQK
jgi:hypothetical protein